MAKGYAFSLREESPHMNVARYIKERSKHYEVVVDPDLAESFKKGKISDVREVLKAEEVFSDAKKGLRPSEKDLLDTFGTKDKLRIAETILRKGIIQVSEKYREELREQKRRRIIDLIKINCVDSKTGLPFPPQRIENAFAEAGVKIDENKRAEDQIQDIIKKLRTVLPIKAEIKKYDILIPAKYASKSKNSIIQLGAVEREKWNQDGSYSFAMEIPAGMREEFFDKINAMTQGNAQIKEIER